MVRLVKNRTQYKLTIPIDLVRDKGWQPGMQFRFIEDKDGTIILKIIKHEEEKRDA